MKRLSKVEQCIAWAAQHGYCFAQDAADEYGHEFSRAMVEDSNTALYNTRSWRDVPKLRHINFRQLTIGQSFDFVDDDNPTMVSFWDRCEKTGPRTYRSLSSNYKYRVGSLNVRVFHVGVPMPR